MAQKKKQLWDIFRISIPQKDRFYWHWSSQKRILPSCMKCCLIEQNIAHIWSHTNEQNFAQIVTFCAIEPYFSSLMVHLFVCIQGYLRSCVCVYIHETCKPLEHTACYKSKHGQMLCIFILTGYFPKFPQPEILYPTEPPDHLQLIRMPAPDRIKILSVCLICEDVFHMPNNYSCKSLSWICKRCCNYTLKLLLKSTMGGGGDA